MITKEEILDKIEKDYRYLGYVRNKQLLNDKEFMLEALKRNPEIYATNQFRFKDDIDVLNYMLYELGIEKCIRPSVFFSENHEQDEKYKTLYEKYKNLRLKRRYCELLRSLSEIIIPENQNFNKITDELVLYLKELIDTLDEKRIKVIELSFGLVDGTRYISKDIAKEFNVSEQRIRSIELKSRRILWARMRETELSFAIAEEAVKSGIDSEDREFENLLKIKKYLEENNKTPLCRLNFGLCELSDFQKKGIVSVEDFLAIPEEEIPNYTTHLFGISKKETLDKIEKDYRNFRRIKNKQLLNDKKFMLEALKRNVLIYVMESFNFKTDKDVLKYIIDDLGLIMLSTRTGNYRCIFDSKMVEEDQKYNELYKRYMFSFIKYNHYILYMTILGNRLTENIPKITDEFMFSINALLENLTEIEKRVIELRFGLVDGTVRTWEDVAKECDVPEERIISAETQALISLNKSILTTELGYTINEEAKKSGIVLEDNVLSKDIKDLIISVNKETLDLTDDTKPQL